MSAFRDETALLLLIASVLSSIVFHSAAFGRGWISP